jgi:hypothetical protein
MVTDQRNITSSSLEPVSHFIKFATRVAMGGAATIATGGAGAVVAGSAIGSTASLCNGLCAYLLLIPTP